MDATTAVRLLTILLTPAAVAGAVVAAVRAGRVLGAVNRRAAVRPAGPPLERLAADLRRLVREHEAVRRSPQVAVRAGHLAALEGAITDCAIDAARALELEPPPRAGRAALSRDALRRLLGQLADAGLVLPGHETFGR